MRASPAAAALLAAAAAAAFLASRTHAAPPDEPPKSASPDAYTLALEKALSYESDLVETLKKVRPASVAVLIKKRNAVAGKPDVVAGCGSGVVVAWHGKTWIITNHHVEGGADSLEVVTLDGRTHAVERVDTVEQYDIALLRFAEKNPPVKGVPINPKASTELQDGQWVLATGTPFFLGLDGRSVATLGVVSGVGRVLGTGTLVYGNAIQHDAAVNPGNSGGPLWNLRGELVGINGMISSRGGGGTGASNTGMSFAIPIDQIQPYLGAMTSDRKDAQAGHLGVRVETTTDSKGTPNGARVVSIDGRSPVREGSSKDLREGDVIRSVTVAARPTTQIRTETDLYNLLSSLPAGTSISIRYERGGKTATWSGKLGSAK